MLSIMTTIIHMNRLFFLYFSSIFMELQVYFYVHYSTYLEITKDSEILQMLQHSRILFSFRKHIYFILFWLKKKKWSSPIYFCYHTAQQPKVSMRMDESLTTRKIIDMTITLSAFHFMVLCFLHCLFLPLLSM